MTDVTASPTASPSLTPTADLTSIDPSLVSPSSLALMKQQENNKESNAIVAADDKAKLKILVSFIFPEIRLWVKNQKKIME